MEISRAGHEEIKPVLRNRFRRRPPAPAAPATGSQRVRPVSVAGRTRPIRDTLSETKNETET